MLGFVPFAALFIWQYLAIIAGMVIYSVYISITQGSAGADRIANGQFVTDFISGNSYNILMLVIYIGYIGIFGLWYWLMFCRKKKTGSWKQVLKPRRIGGIIFCGVALQMSLSLALELILPLFPEINSNYSEIIDTLHNDSVLMILCVCILAPIGEELIFRGLTLRIIKKALPWQAAVFLQALLFGIYHLNLVQGIYAFLLGLLFGVIAYCYDSVAPGILLHMSVNVSSYLVAILLPEYMFAYKALVIVDLLLYLVAAAAFAYLFLYDIKPGAIREESA